MLKYIQILEIFGLCLSVLGGVFLYFRYKKHNYTKKIYKTLEEQKKDNLEADEYNKINKGKKGFVPLEKSSAVFTRQKWDAEKILGYWDRRKLRKFPEKTYFVSMLFPNGTFREFVIVASEPTFDYKGKTYIIDTQKAYWDLMQCQYRLMYHFEYCCPISREIIHVTDRGKEIFLSVNPSNVKELIKQEYVKILASSQNIDMYLKLNMIVSFILLFLMIIMNVALFMLQKAITNLR